MHGRGRGRAREPPSAPARRARHARAPRRLLADSALAGFGGRAVFMFSRDYLRVPTRPPAMATSLPRAGARVCDASVTRAGLPRRRRFAAPEARFPRVTAKQPVELHVISDSTGETAVRLVHALEAQFPDQRVRGDPPPARRDRRRPPACASNRAKGRPAVIVYTLVEPELREAMRTLCRRAKLHYCDLLGHPIEAVAKVSGVAREDDAGRAPRRSTRRTSSAWRRSSSPSSTTTAWGRACTRPTSSSSASRARRRRRSRCTSATWATRPRTSRS